MRVKVKVFGTLAQKIPGYRREAGLDIEMPPDSRVSDLMEHLGFSDLKGYSVAIAGRIKGLSDVLESGMDVHILQIGSGG